MASQPALERRETGETPVAAAPLVAQEDLTSTGQPLDDATRAFFESRFDHDFSRVRVHTDVASTRELNAAAFTSDSDLFFSPGAYRPQTLQGQQLIAHELTHVMQYEASPPREGARQTSRTEDASERQADSFLKHMALGLPVTGITPVAPSAVLSLAPETWFRGEAES
ncbi:MAG TPA: DUF4157 domain-containing protein, partial [Pyrinomonadaceae bacterium]